MRGIAWRRHMEQALMKRRINRVEHPGVYHYRFVDANGIARQHPSWLAFVGTPVARQLMSIGTGWRKYQYEKYKYSANRGGQWYENGRPGKSRLADKREFRDIMREHYDS